MKIIKKRILSEKYLSVFKENSNIKVLVKNQNITPEKLEEFGFTQGDKSGTVVLPNAFNSYAARNAEQFYSINKKLPKEKYTQTLYWTRTQWAGRGRTEEVTELVDITKERYHRDYFSPYSVEFMLIRNNSENTLVSDKILYSNDNKLKIINTINMVLGLFGECEVISDEDEVITEKPKTIRLNWEILPKGKYPWEKIRDTVKDISEQYNKTNQTMMLRNCEEIYKFAPDFIAYGKSGFKGYMVFGFTEKNLYILESMFPNNATYVFENNWEELSKLTKGQILSEELHKARIIHTKSWLKNFKEIMSS